jgi:hypothetical protein
MAPLDTAVAEVVVATAVMGFLAVALEATVLLQVY